METAVSKEVAIEEVNKWLDYKKVSLKRREAAKDYIESLAQGIEDGVLSLDDKTFELTQKLNFTLGENTNELVFKPRLTVGTIQRRLSAVKSGDGDSRVLAYVCALTGIATALASNLDTEDYAIASTIAYFFL